MISSGVRAGGNWPNRLLSCTAWGGSHTGRYSFIIDADTCAVYWVEIDRALEIERCAPPVIVAKKPFAPAPGYILRFDLATGAFSDHVPGWSERGRCLQK